MPYLSGKMMRKRDESGADVVLEAKPCLCNSTYISERCCDSRDGIVHEPEHFQLFTLDEELR